MSGDLVKRLRHGIGDAVRDHALMQEAADRIKKLEVERDSYRATANTMAERAAKAEAERDALRAAIDRAGALACQRASHAFIIDALKEDKNA